MGINCFNNTIFCFYSPMLNIRLGPAKVPWLTSTFVFRSLAPNLHFPVVYLVLMHDPYLFLFFLIQLVRTQSRRTENLLFTRRSKRFRFSQGKRRCIAYIFKILLLLLLKKYSLFFWDLWFDLCPLGQSFGYSYLLSDARMYLESNDVLICHIFGGLNLR